MKTTTLAAALIAALMITSCSDDSTPTAPSALIGEATTTVDLSTDPTAQAPQNVNATSDWSNDDNWSPDGVSTSSYTYNPDAPGSPRNVRVWQTGRVGSGVNGLEYELSATWDPPTWGSTDISGSVWTVRARNGDVLSSVGGGGQSPATAWLEAAEGRFHLALCNTEGCGPPYDAGRIFVGGSTDKPGPPAGLHLDRGSGDANWSFAERTWRAASFHTSFTVDPSDFVDKFRFEYWVRGARQETTTITEFDAAGIDLNGVANTAQGQVALITEGDWTFTVRTRNNRGWGRRAVRRFSVEVSGGRRPSRPTNLSWNDGLISWDPPNSFGGLPLLKYEYYPVEDCLPGHGTPYPLQPADRYVLRSHEVRVLWAPPDAISLRVFNSHAASFCENLDVN